MSLKLDYNSISSNYSCSADDTTIIVNTSSSAVTVTLPLANAENGRVIIIKDSALSASTNNITVQPQSPEVVDGASGALIQTNGGSIILVSSGSGDATPGWTFIATN